MRTTVKALAAVAAATCLLLIGAGVAQADIYWANVGSDAIGRADINGGSVNQAFLSTGGTSGGGVAVDGTYVYWSQWTGAIGRAKLDGSSADASFITGLSHTPTALAVDSGHIYWSEPNDAAIGRANIDGTGVDETFIATDPSGSPDGVTVRSGFIYWADANLGQIGRANLDGTGVDNSFITGLNTPRGVTSDGIWIYWGDVGDRSVGRAPVDGSSSDPTWLDFGTQVYGVSAVAGYLYWTEPVFDTIGRARLSDLSGSESFISGGDFPEQVAVLSAGVTLAGSGAFGNVNVGGSASTTYTVTNSGNGPLVLGAGAVTFSGAGASQWSLTTDGCSGQTVAAGASCTVVAAFAPTTTGAKSATLRFADNAPASPQTVTLTGRGTAATFSASPASTSFGGQRTGTTSLPQTFTIANTASGPNAGVMTIAAGGVTLAGADPGQFTITADGCSGQTVAAGGNCTVSASFAPTSTGAKSASMRVVDDAPGSPHTIGLSGTATQPALALAPAEQDFGAVLLGTAGPAQAFTLSNSGTDASLLGTVTLAGPDAAQFAIRSDGCSGVTLAPGASCTVTAAFSPTAVGSRTAMLQFPNDAGAARTAALRGLGYPFFPPSPTPEGGSTGAEGGGGSGAAGASSTPGTPATHDAGSASTRMSVGLLHGRLTVSRRGRLALRLRCEGASLRTCAGTLQVLRRAGRSARSLSTVRRIAYRIDAGATRTVVVRLRSSVRMQLARSCRKRGAVVRVLVTQVGGEVTGSDRRIAFRRAGCR
jgi:hypothetical protein